MLKAAIETIAKMSQATTYPLKNKVFSDKPLSFVTTTKNSPKLVEVSGIGSLVGLIENEVDKLILPIFVEVKQYNDIAVYGTLDDDLDREQLYRAYSDVPSFSFGWKEYNEAMIAFRSQFIRTIDVDYLLTLLSKITDQNSVSSEDNGLSQTVEVKKGVALKDREYIRPIVKLTPFRTFREIEQPESEFLLRLDEGRRIGLIEADGGMWKLEAKNKIAEELERRLADLITAGKVVVMY